MLLTTDSTRESLSPSPPASISPCSSISSANSSTDTISPNASPPSIITPRLPTHQLFRLTLPHDNQALFLQTSAFMPTGILFHLHPNAETPTEKTISHPDALASVSETVLLGTVNSTDVERFREMCWNHGLQEAGDPSLAVGFRRCRDWVREVVGILTAEEIMTPTPPPVTGNHVPRHHHTQHCQHQRRHIHHPYRRRRTHALLENQILSAAQTVQKRD